MSAQFPVIYLYTDQSIYQIKDKDSVTKPLDVRVNYFPNLARTQSTMCYHEYVDLQLQLEHGPPHNTQSASQPTIERMDAYNDIFFACN